MLFLFATLALLSQSPTFASPTPTTSASTTTTPCQALIEETPWTVTDLTAFDAAPGSLTGSFVTFNLCDQGLQLETTCSRYLPANSSSSPIDPDTYYDCESSDVRFIYAGDSLTIERRFVDDCLGPYPYNSAIVYGTADTDVVNTTSAAGNTCTQAEMLVDITMES